jgi:hypothetical protein
VARADSNYGDFCCCEGFRMPAADGRAARMGGRRRKTPKEETAGREGGRFVTRYGDLSAANGERD